MLRYSLLLFLFLCIGLLAKANLAQDSIPKKADSLKLSVYQAYRLQDSLTKAKIKQTRDSITWYYLKPDPNRENLFVQQMLKKYIIKDLAKYIHEKSLQTKNATYGLGKAIQKLDSWVLFAMLFLLLLFALLRILFNKETSTIFYAFYDNRVLTQINKEDNIFTSWFFLFSYILYSLIIGLFVYLFLTRYGRGFSLTGFPLYISIAFYLGLFLGLKILLLRFVGFIFQLGKLVREYVNVIYITFFNVAVLFIPLTITLILTVFKESNWILATAASLVGVILVLQFARVAVQILSNYKLSKFYLFLYLCTFEICPVLIIIKALNI
ncbi:DUF4271 domain-containing protein [Pedobacter puniceum]|jgi:hypothetical protein|uniref:DUF4271 domain-containing protein n=1 Tax=Pedobacter puniceum TaxID=2666136 RepID=A0A7K0FMB2_9SPHI|nr:DUF4271 domain-containing protein [Pedobacter puniceum]MRX47098.1 DUF4271 domain-containing protein [Pedobacter puniceum]